MREGVFNRYRLRVADCSGYQSAKRFELKAELDQPDRATMLGGGAQNAVGSALDEFSVEIAFLSVCFLHPDFVSELFVIFSTN